MVTWVLQSNLMKKEDRREFIDAFKAVGVPYHVVQIAPFSPKLPNVKVQDPVVAYGTTTLIHNLMKKRIWNPGIFFTPENFRLDAWKRGWGDRVLNFDSTVSTIGKTDIEAPAFIRPLNDLKEFTGQVFTSAEWFDFKRNMREAWGTEITVATPKTVMKEYRFVVVDKQVVGGSLYAEHGNLSLSLNVPNDVSNFVAELAKDWVPELVFVVDVCETEFGLKVIECNCFNGSDFYAMPALPIVKSVSALFG